MRKLSELVKLTGVAFIAILILASCNSNNFKKQEELLKLGIHTVIVKEHLPASQYSYVRLNEIGNPKVKEGDTLWVAVMAGNYTIGDTMYYKGGFVMKNFKSRELNRIFKAVWFMDSLSKKPDFVKGEIAAVPQHGSMKSSDSLKMKKPVIEKLEVKIDKVAGGVTIADLYSKKSSYNGKTIKIKGQVAKFSPDIMQKNWVHIQDGTEANDKYDLTITTLENVKVGDIVTFEGKIALDKDLGFSYFYDVLLEDAKIVK